MSSPDPRADASPASSTHFDQSGNARMVDVTAKTPSLRVATASSTIQMNDEAAGCIRRGESKKGDVLAVARLAAINGCKWTAMLIPLCHTLPIEGVEVSFEWEDQSMVNRLRCNVTVRTTYKTGVEMEAMTAASVATLTIYDMLKSVDRGMRIVETQLASKSGGVSGDYVAKS